MRALITLALAAACGVGDPGPGIDVVQAMAHVTTITEIGPRPRDSNGSRAAAGYVESELDRLGLDVERMAVGSVELPEIRVLGALYREAHRKVTTDPNLIVRFGPPGKALLVMAHYDTVELSPGAIDNAVSVAILLELARVLTEQPPEQPVILAFTANEEVGLVGAEAIAQRRGDQIEFAIALDLIGGSGDLTLNGAGKLIGHAELTWLADAADRAGIRLTAPLAHRVISRWWPQAERSDHGPFTRRGLRAVHFYNRGNNGEWIDLAYHKASDTVSRIDRGALDETGRLLRALVAARIPAYAGDGFWLPFATNVVVPRWLLIMLELLLVLATLGLLLFSREGIVSFVAHDRSSTRDRTRGPGLLLGVGCYVAALMVAIIIERYTAGAHPMPWIHAPLRGVIGQVLVIVGTFGLATRVVARFTPWIGVQRYLVLATIVPLVLGLVVFVIGAGELAWMWLVPAFMLALAPRLGVVAPLAIALGGLPGVFVLLPDQLREAAWNGFLPASLPLAAAVGFFGIPVLAGAAWWLRRRGTAGPLGTLVLGLGCGLAVIIGLVVALATDPTCTAVEFERFHLACERV